MRSSTIVLLISALLLSCSGEEKRERNNQRDQAEISDTNHDSGITEDSSEAMADSKPTPEIQFEPVLAFGSTDEMLLGNIIEFVVDDTGRVFITDWDQALINVFNPDGSYLTSLGREGGDLENLIMYNL